MSKNNSDPSTDYSPEALAKLAILYPPDRALEHPVVRKLLEARDKIEKEGTLMPHYPKGARRFLKIARREDVGNPFAGTLFPLPLSPEDEKEARQLCVEYGVSFPYEKHTCSFCEQKHN